MKIGMILCLAAGPLVALAQKPGAVLRPGISLGSGISLQRGAGPAPRVERFFGWKPPAVELHSFELPAKPVRAAPLLTPDRMCCLVAAGMDPMPVDSRKSLDPMPNGIKPMKITVTVR